MARALPSVRAFLTAAVLLAFVIRLIVVAFAARGVAAPTFDHNDFGWEMGWTARSLFLGRGFTSPFLPLTGPTALMPPLYPYLLAAVFHLFGLYTLKAAIAILSFNSLCSALTCIPLYFLTHHSLSSRAARIATAAWAVYPLAIYFSAGRVWDYALTTLLFTCCLLAAQRLHLRGLSAWAGFGLLYGIAVLVNPSIATLFPVLLGIVIYKVRRFAPRPPGIERSPAGTLIKSLVAGLAFIAVCTPWTIRNNRVMHAHFFLRDGFWIEAYAGNNGDTSESNSAWTHPASSSIEMTRYATMGEMAYIAQKRALAIDFVRHHPASFALSCARRIARFWTGFWSFNPRYLQSQPLDLPNFPFCCFLFFMMVRGLLRWSRENKSAVFPYLLAVLVFPIPYYLTHSSMDYRQPIEPIIVILVTVGVFGTGASHLASDTKLELESLPVQSSV